MNERARWRNRRLFYGGIAALLMGIIGVHLFKVVARWAARHYEVTSYVLTTQGFDRDTVAQLTCWFDSKSESGAFKQPDYQSLQGALVKAFPLVGAVSWARYNPTCLSCTIIGVHPFFTINRSLVAGDNGVAYPKDLFKEDLDCLPHVQVNPLWLQGERFREVFSFFNRCPRSLLESFACTYHDPHMIVLAPKESLDLAHRCVCVVDGITVGQLPDLVALMGLCQALQDREPQREGAMVCYFDFRFPGEVMSKHISYKESLQLQRV